MARLKDAVVQALRCLPEPEALVIAEFAVFLKGLDLDYLFRRAGFQVQCQMCIEGIGWVDFLAAGG